MTQQLTPVVTPAAARPRSTYMPGLDLLRIFASLAVLVEHYWKWMLLHGEDFAIGDAVEMLLVSPFHLNAQLSFVGVAVFLTISGVVVTHVAFRETSGQFLMRRATRLLPAFWVATTIAWILVTTRVLTANNPADLDDLWLNLGLLNYVLPDTSSVLALTWTLAIQVVFYFYIAGTMPLLKRWPWVQPAISLALSAVLISITPPQSENPWSFVRMLATFLPVLFIGQLISLVRSGRLPVGAGVAFGLLQFLLFVQADLTSDQWPPDVAFVRTLVILLLVLLLCSRANGKLVSAKWVSELSKRTYAIYLLHIPVGFPLLELLTPITGYWVSVAAALAAVAVTTELMYRFVELPFSQWYRRRETARSARRAPVPAND